MPAPPKPLMPAGAMPPGAMPPSGPPVMPPEMGSPQLSGMYGSDYADYDEPFEVQSDGQAGDAWCATWSRSIRDGLAKDSISEDARENDLYPDKASKPAT